MEDILGNPLLNEIIGSFFDKCTICENPCINSVNCCNTCKTCITEDTIKCDLCKFEQCDVCYYSKDLLYTCAQCENIYCCGCNPLHTTCIYESVCNKCLEEVYICSEENKPILGEHVSCGMCDKKYCEHCSNYEDIIYCYICMMLVCGMCNCDCGCN